VPPPAVVEPIEDGIEPIDPDVGCVVELDGMLDAPPQAVGCWLAVSVPPEPESPVLGPPLPALALEPASAPAVTMSGCALETALEAAVAEGGGIVRSLWQ
jgi:hypothetical protein